MLKLRHWGADIKCSDNNYKHLAIKITNDDCNTQETAGRVNQGNAAVYQSKKILWSNYIFEKHEIRIYKITGYI